METIMDLLDQKNHYLEKFYSLNEHELPRFVAGNFDDMENFYQNRETILQTIGYIDSKLDSLPLETYEISLSDGDKLKIKEALQIKDQYIHRIIHQDLEILSCVEITKSNIIRELNDVQKVRKAVKGYKSPTFKQRLDEEI